TKSQPLRTSHNLRPSHSRGLKSLAATESSAERVAAEPPDVVTDILAFSEESQVNGNEFSSVGLGFISQDGGWDEGVLLGWVPRTSLGFINNEDDVVAHVLDDDDVVVTVVMKVNLNDLGTFLLIGDYASMLNSLMGETIRPLPLACEWEEIPEAFKAHIFPTLEALIVYFTSILIVIDV
ncbi:hypothetical protein Tco_1191770, partial [Tanacetum coccineum]